ncbi:MAG: TonB C-terminal domain-containing protein [Gemmatimonadales bacterium]|nr:TonB C-terminal domain-containing protein [Gemmatimonadales bacterium]
MTRGLPYSLAFHTIALLLVFLFGSSVSRAPLEPPKSIRVKMVHLPRTRPETNPPLEQPVLQPEISREVLPDLPPKEIPKPRVEAEKPPEKIEDPPKRQEKIPDQVLEDTATEPDIEQDIQAPVTPIALGPSVEGTDSDFPFAWYLARVEGLIARNWNPRQLGFGKKAIVSCAVHFQVAKGGAVSQVTLARNSGIGVYDRESLRAVQTTHLPPLPPQFSGSSLGITFIFNLEPDS